MTKASILPQLVEVMKTGKIHYEIEQSVERSIDRTKEDTQTPEEKEKSECEKSANNDQ